MQRTVHAGILFDLEGRRDAFDSPPRSPTCAARFPAQMASATRPAADSPARRSTGPVGLTNGAARTSSSVDDLVAFALDVWPEARCLPEWRALERRRRVGVDQAPRMPSFVARAIYRRTSEELRSRRWERTGVR